MSPPGFFPPGAERPIPMLTIRHATPADKPAAYEWLCCSDTTSLHLGLPDYPDHPVPTREEFERDFADFYFRSEGRRQGSVMIIERAGESIGCLCYACFHLQAGAAELDIWLKERRLCGHGVGVEALRLLVAHLRRESGVSRFLMRPAARNGRALRAYAKAGFADRVDKLAVLRSFLKEEYWDAYAAGDYGMDGTAVMTLEDDSPPR